MTKQITWIFLPFVIAIIFCAAFVLFYTGNQARQQQSPTAEVEKKRENALPEAKLIALNSSALPDEELRKGKVVLVFVTPDCQACLKEADFLKTLAEKREDVNFYGVVSFGNQEESLKAAEKKFPFKVFYDQSALALKLGITKVPIKVYLEDGIIKKVWGGATIDENKKNEFVNWLENA